MEQRAKELVEIVEEFYQEAVKAGNINEQWFLDFLDDLNAISIRN